MRKIAAVLLGLCLFGTNIIAVRSEEYTEDTSLLQNETETADESENENEISDVYDSQNPVETEDGGDVTVPESADLPEDDMFPYEEPVLNGGSEENNSDADPEIQDETQSVTQLTESEGNTDESTASVFENLEYEIKDETITITGYTDDPVEVLIPGEIDGVPVTVIGESAFEKCNSLKKVTISEGVKILEEDAFFCCESLETVILPSTITNIGYRRDEWTGNSYISSVFYGCPKLKTMGPVGEDYNIQVGMTRIPSHAFTQCNYLEKAVIPDYVTSVGMDAFSNCDNLSKIIIPSSVESFGFEYYEDGSRSTANPLYTCKKLKTVGPIGGDYDIEIGDFQTLPEEMFCLCSEIETVVLPEGMKEIGDWAFQGCTKLIDVTFPESLEKIGMRAMQSCVSLESVDLPDNLKELSSDCFNLCKSLKRINIPKKTTKIGWNVFSNCIQLESAGPAGGDYSIVYEWSDQLPDNAFCGDNTLIEVVLPEGITEIPNNCFRDCNNLKTINLSNRLNRIGHYSFGNCSGLTELIIPESVREMGNSVFYNCSNLESLIIKSSYLTVTLQSDGLIGGCYHLKTLGPIGSGTNIQIAQLEEIPNHLFSSLGTAVDGAESPLESIVLPKTVKRIGNNAFSNCPNLKTVTTEGSLQEISFAAFYNDNAITDVYYGSNEKSWNNITWGQYNGQTWNESLSSAQIHYTFRFDDVLNEEDFFFDYVYEMAEKGVVQGYSDGTFRPYNDCNRAAVVTFLWRLMGKPEPAGTSKFSDPTGTEDFDKAISWASEKGITTGWDDNTFRPWVTCNRAAVVTFLWRAAGKPEPKEAASFSDMTGNEDFDKAISWAAENGITTGWDDNTFRPWRTCNRLAIVSFLSRYDSLVN